MERFTILFLSLKETKYEPYYKQTATDNFALSFHNGLDSVDQISCPWSKVSICLVPKSYLGGQEVQMYL